MLFSPLERKTPDVFSCIVCSFAHLPANECTVYGTCISLYCGLGGFFVIVKSYVINWDGSKCTFVLKFFSFVLYCIVLCNSNTGSNVAEKCCLDLETWSTTTLKVPKCENFHLFDLNDFYVIKSI
jgi:hypothetical protein